MSEVHSAYCYPLSPLDFQVFFNLFIFFILDIDKDLIFFLNEKKHSMMKQERKKETGT